MTGRETMDGQLLDGKLRLAAISETSKWRRRRYFFHRDGSLFAPRTVCWLEFRSKGSDVRDSRNSEAAEVAVQWLSGRQEHASRDGAWYEGPAISDARLAVLFSGYD